MAEILNEFVDFECLVKEVILPLEDYLGDQGKRLIERTKSAINCFLEILGEKVGVVVDDYYHRIKKVYLSPR